MYNHKYPIEHVQTYLDRLPLLMFEGLTSELSSTLSTGSVSDRLLNYFIINDKYSTYILYSAGYPQCPKGRRRSIGDIYCTLKYYDASLTLEELHASLCQLSVDMKVRSFHCGDIMKRVWKNHPIYIVTRYFNCEEIDEYGLSYEGLFTPDHPYATQECKVRFVNIYNK